MSATEAALDQHLRMQDAHYEEWDRYYDYLSQMTSGQPGVTWHKPSQQWQARIRVKGIEVYLGLYKDVEIAIQVRKEAEQRFRG